MLILLEYEPERSPTDFSQDGGLWKGGSFTIEILAKLFGVQMWREMKSLQRLLYYTEMIEIHTVFCYILFG